MGFAGLKIIRVKNKCPLIGDLPKISSQPLKISGPLCPQIMNGPLWKIPNSRFLPSSGKLTRTMFHFSKTHIINVRGKFIQRCCTSNVMQNKKMEAGPCFFLILINTL